MFGTVYQLVGSVFEDWDGSSWIEWKWLMLMRRVLIDVVGWFNNLVVNHSFV